MQALLKKPWMIHGMSERFLSALTVSLLSSVSCAVSAAELMDYDLADLAFLLSKFLDLGILAVLTLLADLADWKKKIANKKFSRLTL